MKKIIFGIVAMFIAAFALYAFTSTSEKSNDDPIVYHFKSVDNESGLIDFEEGEPPLTQPCVGTTLPCRWVSTAELTSPLTQGQIESMATVTNKFNP